MGGAVKSVVNTVGGWFGAQSDDKLAEETKRQTEEQRAYYEAQTKASAEQAKLDSSKTLDNVATVQSGDTLAAISDLSTNKKKQTGAGGISSSLGIS